MKETYGNGITARREYDQQQGFLLDLQFRSAADAPIWDLKYNYDAVGNLKRRERHAGVVGQVPYFAETFGYDEFHRMDGWRGYQLVPAQVVSIDNWSVGYNYDEMGNLAGRATFSPSGLVENIEQVYPGTGAQPHGITAMNWQQGNGVDREYEYDSAGRQWKRPGQTIRYTDFDLPRRIAFDGTNREANFWYDADGSRFRKEVWRSQNLQDVTTYVGGLYERREQTGSAATQEKALNVYYIQAGDRTVAQIEIPDGSQAQDVVKYFHQDHLDSVSFTSDAAGAMEAPVYHDPFGNRFDPTVVPVMAVATRPTGLQNVTRGFTGHEMETEDFGLINMQGRMFDPEAGRFLTADPIVQSPLWGQSYNRYMYVLGNPLTYNDPSGFALRAMMESVAVSWAPNFGDRFSPSRPRENLDCDAECNETLHGPGGQAEMGSGLAAITEKVSGSPEPVQFVRNTKDAAKDVPIKAKAAKKADPNATPGATKNQQGAKESVVAGTSATGASQGGSTESEIRDVDFRIHGGTKEDRDKTLGALQQLAELKSGGKIFDEIDERHGSFFVDATVDIYLNSQGEFESEGNRDWLKTVDKRDNPYVKLDPNNLPDVEVQQGVWVRNLLVGVAAHELGHVANGQGDQGPGRMSHVVQYENPVRRELGIGSRISYSSRSIPLRRP